MEPKKSGCFRMNLIDTLQGKIDLLPDGEYLPGLRAVLQHIETAFRHLARGRESGDDTAFTDAIYRTNQAFEGSIKEAFRVFTGKDPVKTRPYEIEIYLEKNNVFRTRVLSQLSNYRVEWRNPSAHDYKLGFDESEAFLAIVSVSAFSCLLFDQVAERIAFENAQAEANARKNLTGKIFDEPRDATLIALVVNLLMRFSADPLSLRQSPSSQSESQFIGSLHGFLLSAAAELEIQTEVAFDTRFNIRVDLLVKRGDETLVIETKRRFTRHNYEMGLTQLENGMSAAGTREGILMFMTEPDENLEEIEPPHTEAGQKIRVLKPSK